jgi:hypothetical protein
MAWPKGGRKLSQRGATPFFRLSAGLPLLLMSWLMVQ